jgi:anti-sigma B factor antagonist
MQQQDDRKADFDSCGTKTGRLRIPSMSLSEFRSRYFTSTQQADVVVVTFNVSHINDEENIEELGHDLFALTEQYGFRKVILDMREVEYITSSVVGKMITMHRKLHRSEGQLVLCQLTSGVNEVLSASRLLNYFTHRETLEQALEQFREDQTANYEDDETID